MISPSYANRFLAVGDIQMKIMKEVTPEELECLQHFGRFPLKKNRRKRMAFESLTERLQNVFKNLRKKGKISEADVQEATKEIRLALLEADVALPVVKDFIKRVRERAVGHEVIETLNPAQQIVKIVDEELTAILGSETAEIIKSPKIPTIIMMVGLQGAGKTTLLGKLANKLVKEENARPLMIAADIYRPAAIDQLKTPWSADQCPCLLTWYRSPCSRDRSSRFGASKSQSQ